MLQLYTDFKSVYCNRHTYSRYGFHGALTPTYDVSRPVFFIAANTSSDDKDVSTKTFCAVISKSTLITP